MHDLILVILAVLVLGSFERALLKPDPPKTAKFWFCTAAWGLAINVVIKVFE